MVPSLEVSCCCVAMDDFSLKTVIFGFNVLSKNDKRQFEAKQQKIKFQLE